MSRAQFDCKKQQFGRSLNRVSLADFAQLVRTRLAEQHSASPHLDADLLAALAERRLRGRERAFALAHLGECAECREVVALAAVPLEAPAAAPQSLWRRPIAWRIGLVGALAVLAVSATVLLRIEKPAATLSARANPPEGQAAQPTAQVASPSANGIAIAPGSASPPPRPGSVAGAPAQSAANVDVFRAQTRRNAQDAGASTPPAGNLPGERVTGNNAPSATAAQPALPAPLATAPPTPAQAAEQRQLQASARDVESAAAQKNQREVTQPQSAPAARPQLATPSGTAGAARESVEVSAANAALQSSANLARRAATLNAESPAQWRVTPEGVLQRSPQNAGNSAWQPVDVGAPAAFRAVTTSENDVWAGGDHGALFRSADAGSHWTPITPADGEHKLEGDVLSIVVSGTRHEIIQLRTSADQQWTSRDGGITWKLASR